MSQADVLDRTDTNDTDSEDHYAHYADAAKVTEGYIMGTVVMALCGIEFIPSRDPEKLRICPICKKIVEALFLNHE